MRDPVIILSPPHSFTSVVGTMLGQHPQMYGLPEINLFLAETMREREGLIAGLGWCQQGLLRVVAQLFMGQQTVETIARAQRWVDSMATRTCISVFRELAEKVSPRILVDKSPRTTMHSEYLQRARRAFPSAKFIHLLRHPSSYRESMRKRTSFALDRRSTFRKNAAIRRGMAGVPVRPLRTLDGMRMWYTRNMNIVTFLDGLPESQKMRIRGEDLLSEPDTYLQQIAEWLGVRTDAEAIEAMKHPEQSPYACIGPENAPHGNNSGFLNAPTLRPFSPAQKLKLAGAMSRRDNGSGFSPELKELAREFGYS